MKTASPALLALFASNLPFEQFDLYTFTLSSGLVLRYANCAFDVSFGGHTWLCARSQGGIAIDEAGDSGPRAHWTVGLDTGSWSFTVMPRDTDTLGALPWLYAVRAGILQESTCRVDRGYIAAWPIVPTLSIVPDGIINVFFGRTAEIDFGRSSVQININDPRELLDSDQPRNLYTAQCRYALYSPQCTLNKALFATNAVVTSHTSTQLLSISDLSRADNYYALGNLVFTSGDNAGLRMMIRSSVGATGALTLLAPLPFNIADGDHVTAYPGCDKSVTTCTNKFNNKLNYGGFTEIPAAETAV
jgi:hypothetical protein